MVVMAVVALILFRFLFLLAKQQRPKKKNIKEIQKENFRQGKALMLNIHITHHAGTTICGRIGRSLGAPDKFCNNPSENDANVNLKEWDRHGINFNAYKKNGHKHAWYYKETSRNIAIVLKSYRFIAWEAGTSPIRPPLQETNWEDPHLVSVYVSREPIGRILSQHGYSMRKHFGYEQRNHTNFTRDEWNWYLNKAKIADNFALDKLTGKANCCHGINTSRIHLESAQALLRRFTYVLDIACLDQGMQAMANELNFTLRESKHPEKRTHTYNIISARDQIGLEDVYDDLVQQNQLTTELYNWSKNLSLVKCDNLPKNQQS